MGLDLVEIDQPEGRCKKKAIRDLKSNISLMVSSVLGTRNFRDRTLWNGMCGLEVFLFSLAPTSLWIRKSLAESSVDRAGEEVINSRRDTVTWNH